MNWGKVFAWSVVALQLLACGAFAFQKNWKQSLFWLGVALANVAVLL